MKFSKAVTIAFLLAMTRSSMHAQSVIFNSPATRGTWAIRNATIIPVTAPPMANGTIVFSKGKITAIGTSVAIPADATVIDAAGMFVYPGFIDSATNIGLTEISSVAGTNDVNELGDLNPNVRTEVAINPHSNLIPVARVNGITSVVVQPGGGLISGQDALIQLAGWTAAEMLLEAPVGMHINFPRVRSGAFSDEPQDEEAAKDAKKGYTKQIDKLRDILRDARAYGKVESARKSSSSVPRIDRDLILEALVPVVEGRVPIVVHADIAADIREAIKFAREESLRMILSGGDDVQEVIKELKENQIPVLLGSIWSLPQREDDPYDVIFSNPAALHNAGIRFAIMTADAHDVRNLPYQAANCVAYGLPKEVALKAITIYPAEILGVADRIGSLEVGKIANLFVSDGDPLEIRSNIRHLFIGGEPITLDTHQKLLYEKFKNRPK